VDGDGYDDILVGAPSGAGAAYLHLGSPTGPEPAPSWQAAGPQAGSEFGGAVAGAGDVDGDGYADVLVGAPGYTAVAGEEGAVYLHLGSATGLHSTAAWTVTGGQEGLRLGEVLAAAGDLDGDGYGDVALGLPAWSDAVTLGGRVEVYFGGVAGPVGPPGWTLDGATEQARLGFDVAGAGDVDGDGYADLAVGVPSSELEPGEVQLFLGGPTGPAGSPDWTWTGDAAGQGWGSVVAPAGDMTGDGLADVVVGRPGELRRFDGDPSGLSASWSPLGWPEVLADAERWDHVAAGDLDGDGRTDLLSGGPASESGAGDVQVLLGGHPLPATAAALGSQPAAGLGTAVAAPDVDGDGRADLLTTEVGADGSPGVVYVFGGLGALPALEPDWLVEGGASGAELGSDVANVGDVNGDGLEDLAVGADELGSSGTVHVFHGSAGGLGTAPDWTGQGTTPGSRFGGEVSSAGDVDADGFADLLVGARYTQDASGTSVGAAFLYLGSASGLSAAPAWQVQGTSQNERMGAGVAAAGDTNGDGLADVLVGAAGYTNGEDAEGACFLHRGEGGALSPAPSWTIESDEDHAWMDGVAPGGDLDDDGYADVVCAAPRFSLGSGPLPGLTGRVWLAPGGPGGPTGVSWTLTGTMDGDTVGLRLEASADLDGDGRADLLLGPLPDDVLRLGVFFGASVGLPSAPDEILELVFEDYFPRAIAPGDLDGDGFVDLVAGHNLWDDPAGDSTQNLGRVGVLLGTPAGLEPDDEWTPQGPVPQTELGGSVAVGDWNGDGYDDVAAGAAWYSGGEFHEGAAFGWYGNGGGDPGPAWSFAARALQPGTSISIRPWTRSTSPDSFDVRMAARGPFGRSRVKVQVEARSAGQPFDGTGLHESATWTDTGVAGAELTLPVTGLSPQTRYHWRARLVYDPAMGHAHSRSRWIYGGKPGDHEGVHLVTACLADTDGDLLCDGIDPDGDDDGFEDDEDCEPFDATAFPGAPEIPDDGIDQDCSGADLVTCWVDGDGDGFGVEPTELDPDGSCDPADGQAPIGGDCDDADAGTHPGASEVPDDGVDQDCSGSDSVTCPVDGDLDGYSGDGVEVDADGDCDDPGQGGLPGDCDDADPAVHPDAEELCNGLDDDCDGVVDDGAFLDEDGDGHGRVGCGGEDCDDADPAVHPGAEEVCNDIDDDCDGVADGAEEVDWFEVFVDSDGDGWGHPAAATLDGRPGGPLLRLRRLGSGRAPRGHRELQRGRRRGGPRVPPGLRLLDHSGRAASGLDAAGPRRPRSDPSATRSSIVLTPDPPG